MSRRLVAAVAGAVLAIGLVPLATANALVPYPTAPDRQCGWPIAYPGEANYAYPDTAAAYFVQAAVLAPGDEIIVSGSDPKARYWSLQTYRFSDSTLLDSVNDESVRRIGSTWTIRVVSPDRDENTSPNVLKGAAPASDFRASMTVVIYRVYASRTGTESGGDLPSVTYKYADGRVRELETCTSEQVGPPENRPVLEPAEGVGMRFVRGASARFYPSADTAYLVAQAPYRAKRILVMTGKAPGKRDVRYWSVCQNINAGDLPVIDCLRDNEITVSKSGRYAIAVIGDEQVAEDKRSRFERVSFLEWGDTSADAVADAFLLYRNILPARSFAGSADLVPDSRLARPIIGDYAPRLRYMTMKKFKATYAAPRT